MGDRVNEQSIKEEDFFPWVDQAADGGYVFVGGELLPGESGEIREAQRSTRSRS